MTFTPPDNDNFPAAYWFWHTVPSEEEIRWQIAQMAAAGFRTFLPQARLSFPREAYLSDAYLRAYRVAVEEARRLGLSVGIYDDYNWCSGQAAGRTVAGRPDLKERHLFWSSAGFTRGQALCRVSQIRSLMFTGLGAPALDWIYENGRPEWGEWRIVRVLGYPRGEALQDPTQIVDLTGQAQLARGATDGCEVRVSLPLGLPEDLQVTAFVAGQCLSSRLIDYLNPEAVQRYIEVDYEPYRAALGEYFGDPIRYIFFDHPYSGFYGWAEWSGNVQNSLMYSERLWPAYEAAYGEDMQAALLALVRPLGRRTAQLRGRFFDVYGKLGRENFFGQVARWARQNGLGVAGHELLGYVGAWGPAEGFSYLDVRANFGADYFAIEGYRTHTTVDASNYHPQVSAKFGASVAKAHGRSGCMLEQYTYALSGPIGAAGQWDLTLDTLRAQAVRHQLFGCRQFIFHGFYQTDGNGTRFEGLRNPRFDFAPGINFEPWFAEHASFAAESAGLSAFFEGSTGDTQLAVVYPLATYWAEGGQGAFNEHCSAWFRGLLEAGADYDIVDERQVAEARVEGGRLVLPGGAYRAVVLPGASTLWSAAVWRQLEALAQAGGRVILSGPTPGATLQDGADERLAQACRAWLAGQPQGSYFPQVPTGEQIHHAARELSCLPGAALRVEADAPADGTLWLRSAQRGVERLAAVFNDSPNPRRARIALPQAARAWRCWPESGQEEPWPWGEQEHTWLDLAPMELACLRFEPLGDQPEADGLTSCSARVAGFRPVGAGRVSASITQDRAEGVDARLSSAAQPALRGASGEVRALDEHLWSVRVAPRSLPAALRLDEGWTFRAVGEDRSRPIDVRRGWEQQGYAHYSGVGVYNCAFDLPAGAEADAWRLDFGEVIASLAVNLNGVSLGSRGFRPFSFRIPAGVLRAVGNELRLEVRNTGANQYVYGTPLGGETPPPAGLIGAPRLQPEWNFEIEFGRE